MTSGRFHALADAIAALEAEGISVSAKHLHAKMGGSYPTLVRALKQYRQLVAAVAVEPSTHVVVEAPVEEQQLDDSSSPPPDAAPWVPPDCPRCQVRVVWLVHDDLWTCTACSTSIRRVQPGGGIPE